MKYELIKTASLTNSECLILGVFSDNNFTDLAQDLDSQFSGLITRLCNKINDFGDYIWQGDLSEHCLLIINCGEKNKFDVNKLDKILAKITHILEKKSLTSATLSLPLIVEHDADWQLSRMLMQIDANFYQFLDFKTQDKKPYNLQHLQFYLPGATLQALKTGEAIASGIKLTRSLANLPANICTPTYLGEEAIKLAQQHMNVVTKVIELEEIRELGMGAFLAVAQGSSEHPRLIEMHYKGAADKNAQPIVLVGKGITFDSGGISLKPATNMEEMKFDMSGAASILGTFQACVNLNLPINLIGILACAENMPSGTAVKPGDVVTSMSGLTIEILNTDAEGRLVLADALTYAEQFNPEFVIDIATLTGAIVVALGDIQTGFMTTDEKLAQRIIQAAKESNDSAWRMPLDERYQDVLNSPIADIANISSSRGAGSITAACFLSRFTKKYSWAHLDIAGTAWVSGKNRMATGRPVALLTQILQDFAKK